MAKFMSLTMNILAYNGTSSSNDPADADKINTTVQETALTTFTRYNPLVVATGTSNQSVVIPSTATYLVIFTDQTISVGINGAANLTLSPILAGTKTPVYLTRGSITALTISNSSGVSANVDIIAAH